MRTPTFVLLLAAVAPAARSQSVFGTIHGIITDGSGGRVSGAQIKLREIQTNLTSLTSSTGLGLYEFLNVNAGIYEIVVEKQGFGASRMTSIQLDPREVRRVDFQLNLAAQSESVTVESRTIATEDNTLADTKTSGQFTRLPLNYRGIGATPIAAIGIFPGVQQDSFGLGWSMSGGLPQQADVTVDGISSLYVPFHYPLTDMAPSAEMIGEIRVSSVGNNAGYSAMGDMTLTSRSGTNQPHGSLFWYHQNGAFDANAYNSPVKAPKVYNTAGGSFGGPVILPGLYNGRNRTFIFGTFERNVRRSWYLNIFSVPTAAMRGGNLDGLPGSKVVDPVTGAPFPGDQIPAARVNSVARALFTRYYPLPNFAGDIATNYREVTRDDYDTTGFDIRIDRYLTRNQRVFARWNWKNEWSQIDWGLLPESPERVPNRGFVAAHTYTPRSNLSNELRYGFMWGGANEESPIKGKDAVAALGLQGLDLRNAGDGGGFPGFTFSGTSSFTGIGRGRNQYVAGRNFQTNDTLSWSRGAHTLQFGGELRHVRYMAALTKGRSDDFGAFQFSGLFSGNDFSDLLLGIPASSTISVLGPTADASVNYPSMFVRDNWKLGRRFSLELGLRAERHPAMSEASGNLTNFDPASGNVIVPDHSIAAAPGFLTAIGACRVQRAPGCTELLTASQAGLPAGLRVTHFDWLPRVGGAWRPFGPKMAVRGGIGVYGVTFLGPLVGVMTGVHSSDSRTFLNGGPATGPLFTLPTVSPGPDLLGTIPTASFNAGVDPRLRDPFSYQWNVTVERELPSRVSVRASYVGVQSSGMPERVNLNQVPPGPQPFSPGMRPFAHWVQLVSVYNLGFSNYEGLHLEWTRRFANDFSFQASYQLAKDLGTMGTLGTPNIGRELANGLVTDRFDTGYDRGNLPGVRRQRFLLTALLPLPFGRNRAWARGWRGLPNAAFGGWELSTVTVIQTGTFQTPSVPASRDQSNTDVPNRQVIARPDRIGDGNLANPTRDRYYQASDFAFVPAGAGRFGNAGAGILEGPGTVAISAGLSKTFHPTERVRLRTEATFTNLPNHPNFAAPNVTLGSAAFGRLLTTQSTENSGNRTGQIGVRIEF